MTSNSKIYTDTVSGAKASRPGLYKALEHIERTLAGLEAARAAGRRPGRKRIVTDSKITSAKRLLAQGTPAVDVALDLGISGPPSTAGSQPRSGKQGEAGIEDSKPAFMPPVPEMNCTAREVVPERRRIKTDVSPFGGVMA